MGLISRLFFCAATLAFSASAFSAELIPADRRVDWTPGVAVGVPGGIDQYIAGRTDVIDVTQAPYHADRTGATNAQPAIQAAINAATNGKVVYLPAGTYRIDQTLTLGPRQSGVTLRGAGTKTVLVNRTANTGIYVGSGSDYRWAYPKTGNVVTAGLARNSTTLTLGDTAAFRVGQMVRLRVDNDPALPVVSVMGYEGLRRQFTRVTAKTATTLSVFPPVYADYGPRAVVNAAQLQGEFIGIEDLLIDSSNATGTFTIWMQQCYGSWVKNVTIRRSRNYHIFVNDSLHCEVRECYLDELNHTGSNGAGLLVNTVSGSLFENNVIYKAFPLIEVNHGSSGNVFAYNYLEDSRPGVAINSNHGPHNSFNLYEGNVSPNLQADGYFGSVSHDTIFRNWLHGRQPGATAGSWVLSLNRFVRAYSLVGNILGDPALPRVNDGTSFGNPNMGNSAFIGSAPPWTDGWKVAPGTLSQSGQTITASQAVFTASHAGTFILTPHDNILSWISKVIDARTVTVTASRTVSGVGYILAPGPAGYQGLDTGVKSTLLRKANYSTYTGNIPAAETLDGGTLPASLYRTSKPAWFGNLPWPAFDPFNPKPSATAIPAGVRFLNGTVIEIPKIIAQQPLNVRIE